MKRTNITIPAHLRYQVEELLEAGVFPTLNSAITTGLHRLVIEYKFQRWDDQLLYEYKASLLHTDTSGILLSTLFQKDLVELAKDIPGIRRKLRTILFKIKEGKIKPAKLQLVEGLYVVSLRSDRTFLKCILRKQNSDWIACRIGYTTDLL